MTRAPSRELLMALGEDLALPSAWRALAAQAYGWPALQGEGVDIAPGEEAWRGAVTELTAPLVWQALHEADFEEDEDNDEDLEDDDGDDDEGGRA